MPERNQSDLPPERKADVERKRDRLSLHPLTVEDALREAMATGGPPELPKGKRTATKRKLHGEDRKRDAETGD